VARRTPRARLGESPAVSSTHGLGWFPAAVFFLRRDRLVVAYSAKPKATGYLFARYFFEEAILCTATAGTQFFLLGALVLAVHPCANTGEIKIRPALIPKFSPDSTAAEIDLAGDRWLPSTQPTRDPIDHHLCAYLSARTGSFRCRYCPSNWIEERLLTKTWAKFDTALLMAWFSVITAALLLHHQQPPGKSLYLKDDDYRLSLYGSYT